MGARAKGLTVASLIGHVVVAVVFMAVPLILTDPGNRTGAFWGRTLWILFLALLRWSWVTGYLALFLPEWQRTAGLGGVLPGVGALVTGYTTLSALLVLLVNLAGPTGMIPRIHLATQLVLFAVAALLGIGLYFILTSQGSAPLARPIQIYPPMQLALLIRGIEERTSALLGATREAASLQAALRGLRERVETGLVAKGSLTTRAGYVSLVSNVQTLCQEVSALQKGAPDSGRIAAAIAKAGRLRHQVDELSRLFQDSLL